MMKVGLTGGIGSGKTTVCRVFEKLGVPVYYSDDRAKALYIESKEVKQQVIDLLGEDAYLENGALNKQYISEKVFNDKALLQQLNAILHPAVAKDYASWLEQHKAAPYTLKEAAILIESGAYKNCDQLIVVTAPEVVRIERVTQRDGVEQAAIKARMNNQMQEAERVEYADFILENDGEKSILKQALAIHQQLLKIAE
tara:strand:+ start:226 stop:819 length:594 start_codon:yes stop_codon:yes gene_type:complete